MMIRLKNKIIIIIIILDNNTTSIIIIPFYYKIRYFTNNIQQSLQKKQKQNGNNEDGTGANYKTRSSTQNLHFNKLKQKPLGTKTIRTRIPNPIG